MEPSPSAFNLLTMKEVAAALHCSKAHVCNIAAGRVAGCPPLPAVRMGRRLLVRRESLERWISDNESGSIPCRKKTA
jgi:excisionase family DNA binding protein